MLTEIIFCPIKKKGKQNTNIYHGLDLIKSHGFGKEKKKKKSNYMYLIVSTVIFIFKNLNLTMLHKQRTDEI